MIVLIRKWIAWLFVVLIIAAASAYWFIDTLTVSDNAPSIQVMSYNDAKADASEKLAQDNAPALNDVEDEETANEPVANEPKAEQTVSTEDDWLKEAEELKWQRNNELDAEYDDLKAILDTAENAEVRAETEKRMLEIKNGQKIVEQAESMLKLKGYEAVVFVEGEQISAVIDQNRPLEEGIVIAEILERTSGFAKENVIVIPR